MKNLYLKDPDSIVPICYDEMFKAVFGNEKYPNITAYLISLLTNIPYSEIKGHIVFKNTKNSINRVNAKKSDKDIVFVVDLEQPLKVNLEMNYTYNLRNEVINRNIYYTANYYGMGLIEKESYDEIMTTIQYNFNLDYVDHKNKKVIDEYILRNNEGYVLSEKFKIVHINIEELAKIWYSDGKKDMPQNVQILSGLAVIMLCSKRKDFQENIDRVPIDDEIRGDIERIVEEMNYDDKIPERYYNREEELARIDRSVINGEKKRARAEGLREGREEGRKLGIKEGIKEGSMQKSQEIAKIMLKDTNDYEKISKYTGLSIESIKKLI